MSWVPTDGEKTAATVLLADLLSLPQGQQLNVLALVANLWCYRQAH